MSNYTFLEKLYIKSFVGSKEREYLVDNLSMLLNSGMTISESLSSMRDEMESKALKKILTKMIFGIENGFTFSYVLEDAGIFSMNFVSLVKVGEQSGRLIKNLKIIALQERKNRELKNKIRTASLYPGFVFVLMLIISIGIAWFILPKLSNVFNQLQMDLPLSTRVLIKIGVIVQEHGTIIFPVLIVFLVLLYFFVFVFKKTQFIGQWMLFNTPGIGKVIMQIEVSRMAFLMGTLMNAGVTINESIRSVIEVTQYRSYQKIYKNILLGIESGISFKNIFKDNPKMKKYIPHSIQQMLVAGERSGEMPEVFNYISSVYDEKVDMATKKLSTILEPILLVFVWLGVLAVALSVILPVYSLVGGFN